MVELHVKFLLFAAILAFIENSNSVDYERSADDFDIEDYFDGKEYYYVFHLEAGKEQCYFENLTKNSEFNFEIEDADGVDGNVLVSVDIFNGETKRYVLSNNAADRFTIEDSGPLKFCFQSYIDRKIWMYYSIYGDSIKNTSNHETTKLSKLLKEAHRQLSSSSIQINHLIHQSSRHESLLLQKHTLITYFSIIICAAVALSSFFQVFMVKKLFGFNK
ncbi:hypothetical protein MXB_2226 [Myxobolus squamalis]|nr:hypothetical protein MXB_2226 [Myxobolus squamalis]